MGGAIAPRSVRCRLHPSCLRPLAACLSLPIGEPVSCRHDGGFPYGIFLAQEARHYTLAILWVIASLSCLVIAIRHIHDRTSLPLWLNASWIGINTLGIATHYFFSLSLCAEALVLIAFWILDCRLAINPKSLLPNLKSLCAVAAGTLVGGLVWLPVLWQNSYNSQLTQWIQSGERVGLLAWVSPVFQALAGWISMLSLLPVEAPALPVVIASGGVMLIFSSGHYRFSAVASKLSCN